MSRRWIAGVALVVLALGGGAASASPVPAPGPAPAPVSPVAGTTLLKGENSASINVRVPVDAVLDLTPVERNGMMQPKAMRVSGGRHYVGFVLSERSTTTGMFAVAARLPRPLKDGQTLHRAVGYGQPAVMDREEPALAVPAGDPQPATCVRCRVPAGSYRLQLLTFGKPASVSITFEGLRGRTTLRPTTAIYPDGFSGSFRPRGDETHLSEGGGMGLGMGWWRKESGVLLTTYELQVTPDQLPVAEADVNACRAVGGDEHCTGLRMHAGTAPTMGGYGAMSGDDVKEVSTSLSFGTLGYARWVARASMLWVPTRAQSNGVIVPAAQPASGTELISTRVYR